MCKTMIRSCSDQGCSLEAPCGQRAIGHARGLLQAPGGFSGQRGALMGNSSHSPFITQLHPTQVCDLLIFLSILKM